MLKIVVLLQGKEDRRPDATWGRQNSPQHDSTTWLHIGQSERGHTWSASTARRILVAVSISDSALQSAAFWMSMFAWWLLHCCIDISTPCARGLEALIRRTKSVAARETVLVR